MRKSVLCPGLSIHRGGPELSKDSRVGWRDCHFRVGAPPMKKRIVKQNMLAKVSKILTPLSCTQAWTNLKYVVIIQNTVSLTVNQVCYQLIHFDIMHCICIYTQYIHASWRITLLTIKTVRHINHLICGVTLGGAMVCLDSLVWLFLKNIGITDGIWLRGPQHGQDRPALTQRGPDTGQHRADIKWSTNLSKGANIRAHNPTLEAKWRWLGYPCSNQSRGQTWTQRGTNSTWQ